MGNFDFASSLGGGQAFSVSSGSKSYKGFYYEQKVIAHTSLKALDCKEIQNFSLISNPKNNKTIAPFDDIILFVEYESNQNVIYLFQIKSRTHKLREQDLTQKHDSKLNINNMFEKYPEVKRNIQNFLNKKSNQKILDTDCRTNCTFETIIFTDTAIKENTLKNICLSWHMFSTIDGKVYKFKEDYIKNFEPDKQDFFKSISICVGQDSDNIYKGSIRDIENYLNPKKEVKKIQEAFFLCVKNWYEIDDKYSMTKMITTKLLTYAALKKFSISIDEEVCDVKYREGHFKIYLDSLWKTIKDSNLEIDQRHTHYVIDRANEDFNNDIGLLATHKDFAYYSDILKSIELGTRQLRYYIGCMTGAFPYIVKNVKSFFKEEALPKRKIIFVEEGVEESKEILKKINPPTLTKLKQEEFERNTGQRFKIGSVIDEIPCQVTISDLIDLLLITSNSEISCNNNSFIKSRLHKVLLNPKIFASNIENNGDIFVINSVKISEFEKSVTVNRNKFKIIENPKDIKNDNKVNYIYLTENKDLIIKERNVHFIKCNKNENWQLEWIGTIGKTDTIQSFRIKKKCQTSENECKCCVNFEEIDEHFLNQLLIVSGASEVGKTTFLKQIAFADSTQFFNIYVNLEDHVNYLKEYSGCAVKDLQQFSGLNNEKIPALRKLFTNITNKDSKKTKIRILIDGLEKVAALYFDTVSKIIGQLRNEGFNMVLTTKCLLQKKVEETFGLFAISLSPFNQLEQEKFLQLLNSQHLKRTMNFIENNEFFKIPGKIVFLNNFLSRNRENHDVYEEYYNQMLQRYKERKNTSALKFEKELENIAIRTMMSKLSSDDDGIKNYIENLESDLTLTMAELEKGEEEIGILFIDDSKHICIYESMAKYLIMKCLSDFDKPDCPSDLKEEKNEKTIAAIRGLVAED